MAFIINTDATLVNFTGIDNLSEFFKNNHLHFFYEFEITDELVNRTILEHGPADHMVNNFYSKLDSAHNICCIPIAFYATSIPLAITIDGSALPVVKTDYCFNFSANRKRINRFIMIKLIEWFGLTNMDYTWSGADTNFDMSIIIQEMNSVQDPPWTKEFQSFILSPITIQKKWINVRGDTVNGKTQIRPRNFTAPWHAGLDQLYLNSAVSLISESIDYQPGAGYTEKTAFALLGQTFPIWIGGKYQAEQFAKLGYDVFDDVIDHSYQYRDTLIERCYYAIADNLNILKDLQHAAELRTSMVERLAANRQKLLTDCTTPELAIAALQRFVKDFFVEDLEPSNTATANLEDLIKIFPNIQPGNQPGIRKKNFDYIINTLLEKFITRVHQVYVK
jgi:hypothetical protein